MNRPLKVSLAVALALASSQAWALGLGTIDVKSKMNEPLVAEIPVNASGPEELDALKVKLAGTEDFKRIGLDPSGIAVPLDFNVTNGADGRPVIIVTSQEPVREPFLSFLVELNWTNGRLLREFSVLLDPPVAPAVVGTRTQTAPAVERVQPEPEPLPASPSDAPSEPVAEAPEPEPAPAPAPAPTEAPATAAAEQPEPEPEVEAPAPAPTPAPAPVAERDPGEYGPVAEGETLWEIANNTRASGVSVNQMMVAILRANPDAFFKDNVNALKRGAILRIPAREEAATLSNAEAVAAITEQTQIWRGETPALATDTGVAPASTPAPAPAPAAPADSRLALVPPKAGADSASGGERVGTSTGTDQSATLRADLARTQEQLTSREQEAGELRSRVTELEKIQGDSEKLLTLRNSEIADLQRRLREAEAETARLREQSAATTAAAAAAATIAATPDSTTETPDTATAAPSVPPTDPNAAAASTDPNAPAADPNAATATDSAAAATDPNAPVDPAAAAAAAAVATNPDGTPVDSTAAPATNPDGTPVDSAAPVDAATDAAATGAEVTPLSEPTAVTTGEIQERPPQWKQWLANPFVLGAAAILGILALIGLLAASRRRRAPVVATEPRASVADSFGRDVFSAPAAGVAAASMADDEEREMLDRIAADPTDIDAHMDLLRLHYANRDAAKFEAAAGALFAQLPDADSREWREAAAMGRELSPGNPMYDEVSAATYTTQTVREEFDFDSLDTGEPRHVETTTTTTTRPAATGSDFDFDLVDTPEDTARRPVASEYDTAMSQPELTTQQMPVIEPDYDAPPAAAAPVQANEFFSGDDAVGTKLDLARAYLDMGDPEGARSMLEEVVSEGSPAQREEARRLLESI